MRQYLLVHVNAEEKENKTLQVIRKMPQYQLKRMFYNIFPCDASVFGENSGEGNTQIGRAHV